MSKLEFAKSAGKYFLTRDHLGSTTALINNAGQVVQRYNYSSFGKIIAIQDDLGNDISQNQNVNLRLLFTGREWDSEIDLYYFRARYYDPKLGRFYQADPAAGNQGNPITLTNAYIYANNNPVNFSDPMGLEAGGGQSSTPFPSNGGTGGGDGSNGGGGFDLDPNKEYCRINRDSCGSPGIFGVHQWASVTTYGPISAPPPAQPVAAPVFAIGGSFSGVIGLGQTGGAGIYGEGIDHANNLVNGGGYISTGAAGGFELGAQLIGFSYFPGGVGDFAGEATVISGGVRFISFAITFSSLDGHITGYSGGIGTGFRYGLSVGALNTIIYPFNRYPTPNSRFEIRGSP